MIMGVSGMCSDSLLDLDSERGNMLAVRSTLFLLIMNMAIGAYAQPAPPERLVVRSGDQSVVLHWNAGEESDLKGYRIYRATEETGPFEQPVPAVFRDPHFVDFSVENGQVYYYAVRSVNLADEESTDSNIVQATPDILDDDAFINYVQQTAFDYFWYEANPENGLIKDRNTTNSASSIAAVGFGLSAITVGIDRGWLTREEARERVLTTLEFFWNSPQGPGSNTTGYRGFYYHFLDMATGLRAGNSELSTVDTALLLAGILHVGEYFKEQESEEERIRELADSIYTRVEWDWAQPRPPRIGHGWQPDSGHLPFDWGGYNEAMIVYLLALGAPVHTVNENAWSSWTSSYRWETHYGYSFVVFPPLFGHQYTHAWYDFRDIQDAYMSARGIDYFENSRRATLANRAYSIDNPRGWGHYSETIWGLTASDYPGGYIARGAPPAQNDEGTIAPTAAGGSFPFTPDESLAALRAMYDSYKTQIWWRYGFRDAFNIAENWFASDHLGIDQGPIVLMIENHRTGAIWNTFMENKYVKNGLLRAGFAIPNHTEASTPIDAFEVDVFPVPAGSHYYVRFQAQGATEFKITMYDLLGRTVHSQQAIYLPAGNHEELIDVTALPNGMYLLRVEHGNTTQTKKIVIAR